MTRPATFAYRFSAAHSEHAFSTSGWNEFSASLPNQKFQDEFQSILKNRDSESFYEELLFLGNRLQEKKQFDTAGALFTRISLEDGAPEELRSRAKSHLEVLQGGGRFGECAEHLLGNFIQQATDYRMIVPMLAGSAVFGLSRNVALARLLGNRSAAWYSRGLGARFAAASFGSLLEVPAFALSGWALQQLGESSLPQERSLAQDLGSAALTLGSLKLTGAFTSTVFAKTGIRPHAASGTLLFQGSLFFGLMTAHRLEKTFGLSRQLPGGNPALDTLASMLSLSVGGHLGNRALGKRYQRFQAEMNLRSRHDSQPVTPSLRPEMVVLGSVRLLQFQNERPLGSHLAMMASNAGRSSGKKGRRREASPAQSAEYRRLLENAGRLEKQIFSRSEEKRYSATQALVEILPKLKVKDRLQKDLQI